VEPYSEASEGSLSRNSHPVNMQFILRGIGYGNRRGGKGESTRVQRGSRDLGDHDIEYKENWSSPLHHGPGYSA